MNGFICACCGEYHSEMPMDVGFTYPDYWFGIPLDDRESRAEWTSDWCVLDGEEFFIRGCIEIPVVDSAETFGYGVWVSLSEKSFRRIMEIRDSDNVEDEPPYFGWLSNTIQGYPPTLNLKTRAWLQPGDLRPLIELEPTDHPLAVEQREGITLARVQQIVEGLMHNSA